MTPPFEPTIKGADMFGRGTTDDKGQLYVHIAAAEAYLRSSGRLPDRVELIVGTQQGLSLHRAPVDGPTLSAEALRFRQLLTKRTTHQYLPLAATLYEWLIRPIAPALAGREISALVVVPSGALRTIPFAARARTMSGIGLIDNQIYIFGFALMNEIIGNYALRMAGVYMTAINSLWSKTGLMPRWLTIITYILAFGFLVAAERIREARFLFPIWVFVVSVYILILNFRRTHDQAPEAV